MNFPPNLSRQSCDYRFFFISLCRLSKSCSGALLLSSTFPHQWLSGFKRIISEKKKKKSSLRWCNGHCNTALPSFPTPAANTFYVGGLPSGHSKSDVDGNSPIASYQPHALPSSCRTGIGMPRTHSVLWLWAGAPSTHTWAVFYINTVPPPKPYPGQEPNHNLLLNTSTKSKWCLSAQIGKEGGNFREPRCS